MVSDIACASPPAIIDCMKVDRGKMGEAHGVEERGVGNDGAGAGVKGGQGLVGTQKRGLLPRALVDGDDIPRQSAQRGRIAHERLIARNYHVRFGHLWGVHPQELVSGSRTSHKLLLVMNQALPLVNQP